MNAIACVIVTYNRKEALLSNIQSVLNQSESVDIIIIDNASSDGTYEYLINKHVIDNPCVKYHNNGVNMGGAGGFFTGIKMAYDAGYKYYCLMDDDGYPYSQYTIENLRNAADRIMNNNPRIMINSLVVCDENQLSFGLEGDILTVADAKTHSENNEIINTISPFNGTFISRELVSIIGFPNKDFFIHGDEVEYLNRAKKNGAYISTIVNSIYYHPMLKRNSIIILGKKINYVQKDAWKYYYSTRNYIYMYKSERRYFDIIKRIVMELLGSWKLRGEDRSKALSYIKKGFIDGCYGKMGRLEE